jgi:hypothetical protein
VPALPSVPAVVQLAFSLTDSDSGYVSINRLHFHYTGTAPTPAQLVTFATTAGTAFGAAFNPSMNAALTLTAVTAIDLTSPTAATAEVAVSHVGALTGGELPNDTAFVLSAKVARRYRGGHPRTYLQLGDVTKTADGRTWDTAFVTAVETAAAGFFTAVEGAGWTGAGTISPVNVSYYSGFTNVTPVGKRAYSVPTLRIGGPLVDPIVSFVGRVKFGTQRRRLG